MKLAMISNDRSKEPSFYVANKEVFSLASDKPCVLPNVSSNRLVKDIWNIPFAFDGFFFSGTKALPKLDLEVIIAICEGAESAAEKPWFTRWRKYTSKGYGKTSDEFLKAIRKAYPNACVIAYQKELMPHLACSTDTLNFFQQADRVATQFIVQGRPALEKKLSKRVFNLAYPYPIEYVRKNFMSAGGAKEKTLFVGASKGSKEIDGVRIKRGYDSSLAFSERLAATHGFQVNAYEGKMCWEAWLSTLAASAYCVDLDPVPALGQVAIDCAMLGCVHLGSVMEAAKYLFPESASNNESDLEAFFVESLASSNVRDQAFARLNSIHSLPAVRMQLAEILKG